MTAPQHTTAVLLRSRSPAAVASLLATSAPLVPPSARGSLTLNDWARCWQAAAASETGEKLLTSPTSRSRAPPRRQVGLHADQVQDAPGHEVDHVVHRLGVRVERGHRRHDEGSGAAERQERL